MAAGLNQLPFEILNYIVKNFDQVNTIVSFSQLSRRFNQYVKLDGYRVFILEQHPCYQKTGDWIYVIRSLTALSRAWSRKAFIARKLRPPNHGPGLIRLPDDQKLLAATTVPSYRRQTMGYQPVIDCYESWLTGSSSEVLIWGAGAELIMRLKSEKLQSHTELAAKQSGSSIRSSDGTLQWISYKPKDMLDGRDDITAAKLLRPNQVYDDGKQHVILGRASGHLQHITIDKFGAEVQNLSSSTASIDCADVTRSGCPIIAACLDREKVVLHRLDSLDNHDDEPIEFEFSEKGKSEAIWSMKFLSNTLLAIGKGSKNRSLSLLQVTPAGLTEASFTTTSQNVADPIYAIEPLHDNPNLFLTGHYRGHVQLNDLRIPNGPAATYDDPMDSSAIYSLLPMAGHRFIAGGARHCLLKFFDIRRPNWSRSSYTANPNSTTSQISTYNIYLPTVDLRIKKTSPAYALSATSPHASTFYAGVENVVVQMDLHSVTDHRARPNGGIPLLDRVSPTQTQLRKETQALALLEYGSDGGLAFVHQGDLGYQRPRLPRESKFSEGYDDCWKEADTSQTWRPMPPGSPETVIGSMGGR